MEPGRKYSQEGETENHGEIRDAKVRTASLEDHPKGFEGFTG